MKKLTKSAKKKFAQISAVCMAGILTAGVATTSMINQQESLYETNDVVSEEDNSSTYEALEHITKQVSVKTLVADSKDNNQESKVKQDKAQLDTEELKAHIKDTVNNLYQPMDVSNKNTKDETVYVITDATGVTEKIIVSEWINNIEKLNSIDDATFMKDVNEVKGNDNFTLAEDGSLVWNAAGMDVYYQGTSDKQLPVNMKVTYKLDEKLIGYDELGGKSGHLLIRYDFTDNQYAMKEISGEQEKIYVPFIAVPAMIFNNTNFDNITVSQGKVINDGSKSIVVGIAFPGMSKDLKLEDDSFPEYVEVEADVTDFSMDGSYAVVTNSLFNGLNLSDVSDIDEVKDTLTKLSDAMTELMDGSSKLYDGLCELYTKSGDLKAGIDSLAAGTTQIATGADSLSTGAQSLKSGAASLASGLSTLNSKSSELVGGASQVFNTLLSTATAQLTAKGISIPALTKDNYGTVLNGVVASKNQDIFDGVTANVRANVLQQVLTTQGLSLDIYNALPEENKAAIDEAVDTQMTIPATQAIINGYLQTASQDPDYQSLLGLKSQLDSYNQFYQGIQAYTQGVSEACGGAGQISSGAQQLADGAAALSTGVNTLKDGVGTLADGGTALIDGIKKLKDGSLKLRDGLTTFDEEGISQLTSIFGDDLDTMIARLQAVVDVSKEYDTYAGKASTMQGDVKFIFKTAEIKAYSSNE